jgi:transposase
MLINTIGIDLGKTACDAVAMDGRGKVLTRRRLTRPRLVRWLANLPPCRVGMEASCGAHHLARRLAAQGHEVKLMPAQYVRPFVKTNKHDRADAEAICARRSAPTTEVGAGSQARVQRPQMRFVPIKSEAQLDLQALHRARDRLVASRTGLINQIRAFLLERGITLRQGRQALAKALPELLETDELSALLRGLLARLRQQWQALDEEIAALDRQVLAIAQADGRARLLMTVPGIGPLIATGLAAIDSGQAFGRARDLACWLGLVPRQHATGGKVRLLGISKRGNSYLRRLLVHAARAVKRGALGRDDRLGAWLRGLEARAHGNVATVALAAKLARWAWAVLARNQAYRPAAA